VVATRLGVKGGRSMGDSPARRPPGRRPLRAFRLVAVTVVGWALLITGIVALVRRSGLRLEAQRAATAGGSSVDGNAPELVPAQVEDFSSVV